MNGRTGQLVRTVRNRVRLRTRLRRVREGWRRRYPPRLPQWAEADQATPNGAGTPPAGAALRRPATTLVGGLVVADPAGANPRGRQQYGPRLPAGRLRLTPEAAGIGWEIVRDSDRVPVVAGRVAEPLDERRCAVLSQLSVVTCPPPRSGPVEAWAQLVVQLAMTGLVLQAPSAPGGLAPPLAALLASPLPGRDADPIEWELRSIAQRRVAMRLHGAGLGRLGQPPPVSALLVTKRPQLIRAAVAALAAQTYPELEIVVGVHGAAPPGDPAGAGLPAGDRPLRVVSIPAAQPLGAALAEVSGCATGTIVTKVDDDDRYGPEHIWDLVLARQYSGATVVGKGAEFVYLEPKRLTVRRRMAAERTTDTVAGGTIALGRTELAEVGGWPPVPRSVDRALLDRVLAAGGSVYRTHPMGFIYTRHGDGHTWDPGWEYFLRDPVRTWRGLPPYPEFGTEPGAV